MPHLKFLAVAKLFLISQLSQSGPMCPIAHVEFDDPPRQLAYLLTHSII